MFVWEFLAVGAIGFWALLLLSSIIMSEMMDNNAPGWATIVAIVTVAVLVVFGGFNPITYLAAHPGEVVLGIAAYFVTGAVWSLAKWYFWLVKLRRQISDADDRNRSRILWLVGVGDFPPSPGEHKSRIIGWIALWPASMLWTLINDPVRRAAEEIYARLGGTYQSISNRVFQGHTKQD
jgi:hypothetical protein